MITMQYFYQHRIFIITLGGLLYLFCSPLLLGAKVQSVELKELEMGAVEPQFKIHSLANTPNRFDSILNKKPFTENETLVYNAYHITMVSRILAGHCYMRTFKLGVKDNRPLLHFQMDAISAEWYSWFFVIKDRVVGYFDIEEHYTYFLNILLEENTYNQNKTIVFDHNKHHVIEKSITKGRLKYHQYHTGEKLLDPYSFIYHIRSMEFKSGKVLQYPVYASGKKYILDATILDEEKVTIHDREYPTYKVVLNTKLQGSMEQAGGIFIYFTKDKYRIPVKVEADVKVGRFVLELVKHQF